MNCEQGMDITLGNNNSTSCFRSTLKKTLLFKRKEKKNAIKASKRVFRCPKCNYITDRKNNLKRHVSTMHEICDKILECCDTVFPNKASLREHVTLRHKEGYVCRECGRNFCRKALLKRHVTVHSGQKDYVCSICGYATSHKSNLDRHTRRHRPKENNSAPASPFLWRDSHNLGNINTIQERPLTNYGSALEMDLFAIKIMDKYNKFLDGHVDMDSNVNFKCNTEQEHFQTENKSQYSNQMFKGKSLCDAFKIANNKKYDVFCENISDVNNLSLVPDNYKEQKNNNFKYFLTEVTKIENRCSFSPEESSTEEDTWENPHQQNESNDKLYIKNSLSANEYYGKTRMKLFPYIYKCDHKQCPSVFTNQMEFIEHARDVCYHNNQIASPQRPLTLQVRAIIKNML